MDPRHSRCSGFLREGLELSDNRFKSLPVLLLKLSEEGSQARRHSGTIEPALATTPQDEPGYIKEKGLNVGQIVC
jgi:hypothetical protein